MRKLWLKLRLWAVEIALYDSERVLQDIHAERPIVQARICQLADEAEELRKKIKGIA